MARQKLSHRLAARAMDAFFSGVNQDGQFFIGVALGNASSDDAAERARDALPLGMVDAKKEYEFYDAGGAPKEVAPVETASEWTYDEKKVYELNQSKDYSSALTYAKRALDNRYTHEITMLYGFCFLMLNNYQEAWNVFDKEIRERYTNDPLAYHYRGDMSAKLQKWDAALQDYNSAISKGYKDDLIYRSKGSAQLILKEYDGAIQSFNQYMQNIQSDYAAYHMRGLAYAGKNAEEDAKNDFSKAIELGSNLAETYFMRGKIYLNQQKAEVAIKDFTKTTELVPEDAAAWYFLGYALAVGNKMQTALEAFNTCIRLSSVIPEAWMYRGYIKLLLNDKVNAETDFSKAIQLNPELKDTIAKMKGS